MTGSTSMFSKTCSSCKEVLPLTSFNKQAKTVDGHQHYCRECQRNHKRLLRYGVNTKWYEERMHEQGCRCAVCGVEVNEYLTQYKGKRIAFDIDHCHVTGKARELLCNRCNMVLGQVNDDIDLLKHMIRYLRKHKI